MGFKLPRMIKYFPHDYFARNDIKCQALISDFGYEGYGLYVAIYEILHEQGGKIKKFPKLYEGLAFQLKVENEPFIKLIEALIKQYELLAQDDNYIWSNRVLKNLDEIKKKFELKSKAGRLGGLKSGNIKQKQSNDKAVLKQRLSKGEAKSTKYKYKYKYKNNILQSKDCEVFKSEDYFNTLIADNKKHVSLIGKYFKKRSLQFPNKKTAQKELKRWLKDAEYLSNYKTEEVERAYEYVSTQFPDKWNLSTMRKYIADPRIWN